MSITKTELFTILSLIAPFIFTLFFFRNMDAITFLGLLLFNALFIAGCFIMLLLTKQTKFKKGYYFMAAFISITVFFSFRNQLINTSDRIFFSLHRSKMMETVVAIKKAKQENKPFDFPELNFASVDTLESGEVIFALDGMLDNCVGIAYSEANKSPGYTNCGRIIEWKKLDDHWYWWYTT